MALTTIQAVYDEARAALETGKDERAIGLSEHLLESFPHYLEAYRLLGESHLNRQEPDQAAAAFERVLRADPENIPVYVGLGVTYERQGRLADAIRQFERAFEIKPDLPELRSQLLRLYAEAWGGEHAQVRLKKAGLARLYVRGNRYDKAIQEFQDVLAQEPDRRDVQVALAEAYWRNSQEEDAAEMCRSILAADPDVLKANLILGYILLASGDPQGKRLWQHAQQLDPSQGVAFSLFDGMMPPVEAPKTAIETFDEAVWRQAKADKERQAQEAAARAQEEAARAERERREAEEREHAAALAATQGVPAVAAGSWLDEAPSPPRAPARSAPVGMDDDFLKALLLGTDAPPAAPAPAP
ncbi:MAG TPA: tetratricopeptide repeat protein, partial [Herpetosiphonaceae bacterium]|nr:tetratricopeptide repeat protein [Herpetosiphonaceae bacterium]